MDLKTCFLGGLVVRLVLLLYGIWQDEHMTVKYTDVDYWVFTDAAKETWNGGSPFDRLTYRYTPLVAWINIPNVVWFQSFGKVVFVLVDMAVGWLIHEILQCRGCSREECKKYTCVWLFHPYSINISTRGNADSIICLLLLCCALNLMRKQTVPAAILFGLAAHFRIFPILFAFSMLFYINDDKDSHKPWYLQAFRERFRFALMSGLVFLGLNVLFYSLYGWEYLYESLLYHIIRTDNRHNFSVYFYSLYLQYGQEAATWLGLVAFLPQLIVQISISVAYHKDILLCVCLQTIGFVAFNKVCTAQYFVWYASLIPVILPNLNLGNKSIALLIAGWLAAQLLWLSFAYKLEFLGQNTFLEVWMSSVLFFMANITIILSIMIVYDKSKSKLS